MIIGLLKFFIFILLGYLIAKLVVRILFPFLFGIGGRSSGQYKPSHESRKKEGDVTIDYKEKKEKRIGKDEGDYIDYEEVN